MELVSLWVVCMAVTTVLVPLAGVIAGIIIAQVRKDKGWYLLTLVCAYRLVQGALALLAMVYLAAVLQASTGGFRLISLLG